MSKPFAKVAALTSLGLLLAACGSMRGREAPTPTSGSHMTAEPTVAESRPAAAPVSDAVQLSFRRATTAMQRQQWNAAETELRSLATGHPDLPGPQVNLALVYRATARVEQAGSTLRAAAERWPNFAPAQLQLGLLLQDQGKFREADAAYARAIEADPTYALAYYDRAVLNELYLQNLPAALAHYEQYQQKAPQKDAEVERWIGELRRRTGVSAPAVPATQPNASSPPTGSPAT